MVSQRLRILVVEDNRALSSQIEQVLKTRNFQICSAVSGLEGLIRFEQDLPDLVVLNLHLPGLNGLEVCRRIRQRSAIPIIMLSALRDDEVKIAALNLGVDDYLLIPFDIEELRARVRAVLRRSAWTRLPEPGTLRIGNLEIDLEGRQLLQGGQNVRLSRTEWTLLELLIGHAGRVVTHRMLSQSVWGDGYSDDNTTLRVAIGRLRKKLKDDPANPQYLLTEPGIGYYFSLLNQEQDTPLQLLAGKSVPKRYPQSPTSIPSQRTSFIGREEEITHLKDLLCRLDVRIVTLIGPGGSGKTRLSLQVAAALQDAFEQGIVLVTLASISNAGLVKTRIAQVLGLKERADQKVVEELKNFLRDRDMLLILDNFEQVVTAAPLIAELLDTAPGLKLLITSRIRLNIAGEHIFEVPPLPLPDLADLPGVEVLTQLPAIALFTARAQAIKPDFVLNEENAQKVAQICVHLDGLPLAIELAAARIKVLSPDAMLTRLSSRLSLLVGGERDRPERQQTIRNMLDWSYNLLDAPEKILFSQLAVFAGGCTLEAAEAICTVVGDQKLSVIDGILSLLDKSMLQQRVELLLESYSVTRFSMLELIREYAQGLLLETEGVELLRERHLLYYLALVERAEAQLAGPQEEILLIQLERDHDNLQAAIQCALDQGKYEIALRLCAALWKFWHVHGSQSEGRHWIDITLASTSQIRTPARVKTLYGAGWIYYDQGDWEQAAVYYEESLALARELNDLIGIGEALHGVGEMARLRGDYIQSIACYEESLACFRGLGNREGIAWSLDHLGRLVHYQGDHERAITLVKEALSLFKTLEYRRGMAYMLGNLGAIMLQQGDLEPARRYLEESLSLHEKVGDRHGASAFLIRLAEVALYQGEPEEAHSLLTTCLLFSQELGYRWYSALALNQLAQVAIVRGDYEQARLQLIQAFHLCQQTRDNMEGIIASLEGFAELEAAQHRMALSLCLYSAAVAQRQMNRLALPPTNRIREERIIGLARTQLSEPDFTVAWGDGQKTPYQTLLNAEINLM